MGWIKTHIACEKCSSSDGASISDTGWIKCFSCGKNYKDTNFEGEYGECPPDPKAVYEVPSMNLTIVRDVPSRGLTEDTCRKWDYRIGTDENGKPFHLAVYRKPDGAICGGKLRRPGKQFLTEGVPGLAGLYGRHLWGSGGKSVIITEGELDALSVSQAQDNKWPVVSLINGAHSAVSDIKKEITWLESFDKVVLMFDNDDVGREAVAKAVSLFSPGKVHVAKLPSDVKDASDLLKAGRQAEIIKAYWNASPWRPDEIIGGDELLSKILEPIPSADAVYPFEAFNEITRGIRKRELVTITAGTGIGKSHLCREISKGLLDQKKSVGYIALEESVSKTGQILMAMYANVPWMDWSPTPEERTKLFNENMRDNFWTYDHWGSQDTETLLSRIRYMAVSMGVEYVFLDHVSIVVSGMENNDERRGLDLLMTQLRSMAEQTGIGIFLVSHLKKADGTPHEEGGRITLKDLRSSNSIAQLSDIVIALERDQQSEEDSSISTVRCLKNRFTGETGILGYLRYNKETGRQETHRVIANEDAQWEDVDENIV